MSCDSGAVYTWHLGLFCVAFKCSNSYVCIRTTCIQMFSFMCMCEFSVSSLFMPRCHIDYFSVFLCSMFMKDSTWLLLHCFAQEIWANAYETHESLYQFLFAGCLGLWPSISSQFTSLQPKIAKKITKSLIFHVRGHWSFKIVYVDTTKKHVHVCVYLQAFSC